MKIVYICSPLRGDYERNIKRAKCLCRKAAIEHNVIPIAPHIYFTQFLDDANADERQLGMDLGLELLERCDEVWVDVIDDPSEGMNAEIALAKSLGIPVIEIREALCTAVY